MVYLVFIILEGLIKASYGIVFIYYEKAQQPFSFTESRQELQYLIMAISAYLFVTLLSLTVLLFTKNYSKTYLMKSFVNKAIISSIITIHSLLNIPILICIFQTMRLATQDNFKFEIKALHLVLALFSLLMHGVIYSYKENFFFCYYYNKHLPWSRPESNANKLRYIINILFSLLIVFSTENSTIELILMCLAIGFQMMESIYNFLQAPYFNYYIDITNTIMDVLQCYIYFFTVLKYFIEFEVQKTSFLIIFSINLFIILITLNKLKQIRITQVYTISQKRLRHFQIQLVQLIRLINRSKGKHLVTLQQWILSHNQQCQNDKCNCQFLKNNIQRKKTNQITKALNSDISKFHSSYLMSEVIHSQINLNEINIEDKEDQSEDQVEQLDASIYEELYLLQHFQNTKDEDENIPTKERFEKKIKREIVAIISQEMEENTKMTMEIQLLRLCYQIFLSCEPYKAFFQILQLEQQNEKQSLKQQYMFTYLKKHLINIQQAKEKFNKDQETLIILNQLKFEKSFNKFLLDIEKITDTTEELWRQSISKNFKILQMYDLMNVIGSTYLQLWVKFQQLEDKYLNAELLLIFGRFCDFVMCFELEAENFYLKGMSIVSSIKMQQSKGNSLDHLENKIKSQEVLISIQCFPKCLDKITFANQKFYHLTQFKKGDINEAKHLMPLCLAAVHDDMIVNYLINNKRKVSKLHINSWLRVKSGYLLPIQILSYPQLDIKHNFRFTTLLRPIKELYIADQQVQSNSIFTFLVNQFAQIEGVSKECQEIFNISPKLLDNGLFLAHIFENFSNEGIGELINGQLFIFYKKQLHDLQLQLDMEQIKLNENNVSNIIMFSQDIEQKFNLSYQDYIKRFDVADLETTLVMKVFITKVTLGQTASFYYEVNAVPIYEQYMANENETLGVISTIHLNEKQLRETDNSKLNHSTVLDEELNDLASQSSITSSNTSKNSKQFEQIRDIKEITAIKGEPIVIKRLSRSLNIFFFVMLLTSIVLLVVNINDKNIFQSGVLAIQDAFRLQYYIANIRLRYLYFFAMSNFDKVGNFTKSQQAQVELVNAQYRDYLEDFRDTINHLTVQVKGLDESLQLYFSEDNLILAQVSQLNILSNLTVSYQSACQQVIAISDQYSYANLSALRVNRSIIGFKYGIKTNYMLTNTDINSYFVLKNLEDTIKDRGTLIQDVFSNQVVEFGNSSSQSILIFTIVCIVVVLIAGILLLPMLFTIDNNLEQSVKSWTIVTDKQRQEQITRIELFKQILLASDLLHANNDSEKQQAERKRIKEKFIQNQQTKFKPKIDSNDKLKSLAQPKPVQKINFQQKKKIFEEDLIDEEEEKEEEDFDDHKNNHRYHNQKKKQEIFEIQKNSKHKSGGKEKLPKGIKESSEISDSDDNNNKKIKSISENEQETEVDRIHKQQQQISLSKYIITRKIKISIVVLLFTLSLCSLYIGSYLLAYKIYEETLSYFDLLTIVSDRAPCVARSFFILYYTYMQNQTFEINRTDSLSNLIPYCLSIEQIMRKTKRQDKAAYQKISGVINILDSSQFCDYLWEITGETFIESEIRECHNVSSDSLQLGLSSNIEKIYSYIQQKNIVYINNVTKKTEKYILNEIYNENSHSLLYLYFVYIDPVLDYLQQLTSRTLFDTLQESFNNLIIMFTIFLIFIIASWYCSQKILIKALSDIVKRSKIAIKMIPAYILLEIKQQQRDQQKLR